MADSARKLMSLAAFLDWDDGSDRRYELVVGEIRAMAPPTRAHGTMVGNIVRQIGNALRPPCVVIGEAGIVLPDRADAYYQADLAVTCTPAQPGERAVADPVLIVEVLSPSTADRDRGVKLVDYRQIPSVHEILLVSSEERRAELWRRMDGQWLVQDLIGEATIRLESCGLDLAMAAIYDQVAV